MQREVFLDTARQTAENAPRNPAGYFRTLLQNCERDGILTAEDMQKRAKPAPAQPAIRPSSEQLSAFDQEMVRAGQAVHKGKGGAVITLSTAPVSAIMRQTREVIRMGYIRRPAYYKAFRCIGSDCTENCCIGWEIDVDEDSLCVLRDRSRRFWRAFAREHCACGRADRRAGAFSSGRRGSGVRC